MGAVVPVLLLGAALALIGLVLDRLLLDELDRALLGQAAVESVSLFDRLAHEPHLHLDRSPMPAARELSASGALYGPDGRLLVQTQGVVAAPAVLRPEDGPAKLETADDLRVLVVTVRSPEGRLHALRLAASLGRHRAVMRSYAQAATGVGLAVLALLAWLQVRHARALDARIQRLAAHMQRLRSGNFDDLPDADSTRDVIGDLRAAIAETTLQLRAAREAQERLLADAAHELRTPLAAMRTGVDLALRRERTPDELRETLARTREEVDRLTALAQRLLDLAAVRQAAWDMPEGELVAVVEDAMVAHAAAFAARDVGLVRAGEPQLHRRFQADPLRQVLDNLLANAIRFAPVGSTVTVEVAADGSGWRLAVCDRGPGVPEGEREAVFAPFARLDKSNPGAGLGLAIVQDVARRHGGRAWVEDAAPGARIVVTGASGAVTAPT
jgi:signal transduction histidine kinase